MGSVYPICYCCPPRRDAAPSELFFGFRVPPDRYARLSRMGLRFCASQTHLPVHLLRGISVPVIPPSSRLDPVIHTVHDAQRVPGPSHEVKVKHGQFETIGMLNAVTRLYVVHNNRGGDGRRRFSTTIVSYKGMSWYPSRRGSRMCTVYN